MDELKHVWSGSVPKLRSVMEKFETSCGEKLIFPCYFNNRVMVLAGGIEVENNSEIYFYRAEFPVMEIAMPISHKNITINLKTGATCLYE